jgi:ribose 5-phosphate isomerase A
VNAEDMKKAAAEAAVALVKNGQKLGLGTGSTANHFIDMLGERIRKEGLDIVAVPTSKASHERAKQAGIKLVTLEDHPRLDLTVDGADEFDPGFQLIKGGGGALLFEKIVAASSRYFFVITDESKKVEALGKFPLPIEVVPFGFKSTALRIERVMEICGLKAKLVVRTREGKPYVTDAGHIIVDAAIGRIPDARKLASLLSIVPGVVDHGLFIDLCGRVIMGTKDGVQTFIRRS